MEPRIFGLTSEYRMTSPAFSGEDAPSVGKATGYPRRPTDFLMNGARLSRAPCGSSEYATPECDGARTLVLYEKAGERLVEERLLAAEQMLRENGVPTELLVVKHNADSVGNTYGCHESYLVQRRVTFHKLAQQLIPFLVTRQVFAGAGKVLKTRMGTHYYLSQRAQHIYQEVSGDSRAMISTRDEPHADEEKYRRLQVMVGDSNMSEFATYLKVGTTAIVLSMIEDGGIQRDVALEDPVRALKEISHDVTCTHRVKMRWSEKALSAIEIQREYLECALEYYQSRGRGAEVADLLEKWQHVLDRLAEDPMSLNRELDWVMKRTCLTREGCSLDDPRAFEIDVQYHDIKRTRGLYYRMVGAGSVRRVCTGWEVDHALRTPPQTTRAKIRSDFIAFAKARRRQYDVGWSYLRLRAGRQAQTVLLKDPFSSWDPRVEQWFLSAAR